MKDPEIERILSLIASPDKECIQLGLQLYKELKCPYIIVGYYDPKYTNYIDWLNGQLKVGSLINYVKYMNEIGQPDSYLTNLSIDF